MKKNIFLLVGLLLCGCLSLTCFAAPCGDTRFADGTAYENTAIFAGPETSEQAAATEESAPDVSAESETADAALWMQTEEILDPESPLARPGARTVLKPGEDAKIVEPTLARIALLLVLGGAALWGILFLIRCKKKKVER